MSGAKGSRGPAVAGLIKLWVALTRHSAIRYLLVGGGLFVLDLLVFLGLTGLLGVGAAPAQMVARGVGAGVGFVGHRHFSFRQSSDTARHGLAGQGGGYFLVTVLTFLLSPVVVVGMLELLDGRVIVAKVLAEVVLVSITYAAMKLVFRKRERV